MPFDEEYLFGASLNNIIWDVMGGQSTLLLQLKKNQYTSLFFSEAKKCSFNFSQTSKSGPHNRVDREGSPTTCSVEQRR